MGTMVHRMPLKTCTNQKYETYFRLFCSLLSIAYVMTLSLPFVYADEGNPSPDEAGLQDHQDHQQKKSQDKRHKHHMKDSKKHTQHRPAHHHQFDPETFVKRWEGPTRDQEQQPTEVLKACGVQVGMRVVDLGAGTGYFLPYLSQAVGGSGHVQGLDLEPKMVAWMQKRIEKEGLKNSVALVSSVDKTPLEAHSIDRILIVNVWHHIDQRQTYLNHLVSRLKADGALCIVEIKYDAPHGPPLKHRISPQELHTEIAQHPELDVQIDPLQLPHQYLVIARKK